MRIAETAGRLSKSTSVNSTGVGATFLQHAQLVREKRMKKACLLTLVLAFLAATPPLWTQGRSLQQEKIGDGTMVTVLTPDAIPALSQPAFVSREEADKWMAGDEPVLGLVDPVTGQAKAYSLWHLEHHEIVNDRLGGHPIAVTW